MSGKGLKERISLNYFAYLLKEKEVKVVVTFKFWIFKVVFPLEIFVVNS